MSKRPDAAGRRTLRAGLHSALRHALRLSLSRRSLCDWCMGLPCHWFLTLIFPVIGEIYWVYATWQRTGEFWSILAIGCALYVCVWTFFAVLVGIAAGTEPSQR